MEAVLNAREYLRVSLQDRHDFGIRLLNDTDRPGEQFGPSGQARSMMWCSEEGDTQGRLKDVLKVWFRSLFRYDQSLPRTLANIPWPVPEWTYILTDQAP